MSDGQTDLAVVAGDIAALAVDAVVNAANDHLWMGSGVAGALRAAGGVEIEEEAVGKGPIPVGTAVVTRAGRLPARWVIHAAVMGQDLRSDEELVRRATKEALEIADRLLCATVALPAFGTGVGGLPLRAVATWMSEVALRHEPKTLRAVTFVVRDEDDRRVFQAGLDGVFAAPPARREGAGYFDLHDD
jgi:O-acetyl-ADP-ribose deacetylase (regulator of RNase III)